MTLVILIGGIDLSVGAMLALVTKHDLKPEQVQRIRFYAGKNILEPIRYPLAKNHLQAKFSMPALLCMILLKRRASHHARDALQHR